MVFNHIFNYLDIDVDRYCTGIFRGNICFPMIKIMKKD